MSETSLRKIVIATDYAVESLKGEIFSAEFVKPEDIKDPSSVNYLPSLRNTAVFIFGSDAWSVVKEMSDLKLIHIGLRHFNFNTLVTLPYTTMANNVKLVCSYGQVQGNLDMDKIRFFRDGDLNKEVPILEEYEVLDISDFDKGLTKLLEKNPTGEYFGLDAESRGFPLTKGFKTLGFSLVGSNYGFYVNCRNYPDFHHPIYNSCKKFVEDNYRRLVVYNCNFEIRWLKHMWQETFFFPDAWCLVLEDDFRAGLKPSAQYYLGVPSWDNDLEYELDYFDKIMWGREPRKSADGNDWEASKDSSEFFEKLKDKSHPWYAQGLVKVMNDSIERRIEGENIPDEEIPEFSKKVKAEYRERIVKAWGNSWEMCDPWTLGKYCIYDSFYTKLIWDLLKDKYPRANEPYHKNFYYGALLESTAIPINKEKLFILTDYVNRVKDNTSAFYLKFYRYCLEDNIGSYVDSLKSLNEYSKNILLNASWVLPLSSDKALKGLLKASMINEDDSKVDWKKYATLVSKPIARMVWEMVNGDTDKNTGMFSVASACRKHRNQWVELGNKFEEATKFKALIREINDTSLKKLVPTIKAFNERVKNFVSPYDPKICKIICNYFEDAKLKKNPYQVVIEHPEWEKCFRFVKEVQKEWDSDYWSENFLGGKDFKAMYGYVTPEELSWWRDSYNFLADMPAILLREFDLKDVVTVEEVVDLLTLRAAEEDLKLWDTTKVDEVPPKKLNEIVQWSSDKRTFVVVIEMLKKYGSLCAGVTHFWNYWWSPEHKPEQDSEFLDYAIKDSYFNPINYQIDTRDYAYQSGDNVKKNDRCVSLVNFGQRFGFERSEIRSWHMFNVNKDSFLNIEPLHEEYGELAKLKQDWENLYKFLIYWDMGQAAVKQLNPYLEGDKGMIENSHKLEEVLSDGSEVIDMDSEGDRFVTRFKICGVSTKRTSGFFHEESVA